MTLQENISLRDGLLLLGFRTYGNGQFFFAAEDFYTRPVFKHLMGYEIKLYWHNLYHTPVTLEYVIENCGDELRDVLLFNLDIFT